MKLIERPLRRSPALTVRTTIAACLALLVVAVGLGMRWPNTWWGSGPGDATRFDYSALDARFGSLRDDYLTTVLGGSAPGRSRARTPGFIPATRDSAGVVVAHGFTNDHFEHAYEVTGLPFRGRTDSTGATRQAGEPVSCHPAGGTSWYRYQPRGDVALFADTFGTGRSSSLGVYTGRSRDALELIGCDTNVLGNAQVGFRAAKGKTYYFQLTSTVEGGTAAFELAAVGATTIESVSPSGGPSDLPAVERPNISGDGRYVAFMSWAQNLAPTRAGCGDARYCLSLYLRDRLAGTTSRVAAQSSSVPPDTNQGSAVSLTPSLSADGRYVGFSAHSYVEGDHEGYRGPSDAERPAENSYLYDRVTGRVEMVSRNSAGEPARRNPAVNFRGPIGGSSIPSVSADGRYVSFNSDAENLGGPIEPQGLNVYRRDRVEGVTRLVSTDASGEPMGGESCAGTGRNISGDGRYVVFRNRPVEPETQGAVTDGFLVYLWDAETGATTLVSKVPSGRRPAGSYCPAISMDGSRVGLVSLDPLVPEDTNGTSDVYVYEVATGHLQRISVTAAGEQTYDPNYTGREHGFLRRAVNLSGDGRFAVFDSAATDLAPSAVGSTRHPPNTTRVFVHDILTGATVLASVSSTGEPLPGDSHMPYISPDGRSVAFMNLGVSGQREVMVHQLR